MPFQTLNEMRNYKKIKLCCSNFKVLNFSIAHNQYQIRVFI